VVSYLAEAGFDARYGARPLKRTIEREMLAPMAHQMNRYSAELALDINVGLANGNPTPTVKPRQEEGRQVPAIRLTGKDAEQARECIRLRRLHQLLERSSAVRDLDNEVYQLEQLEKTVIRKQLKARPLTNGEQMKLAHLGRLREIANEVRRQRLESAELEDAALFAFQSQTPIEASVISRLTKLSTNWDELLLQLYRRGRKDGMTMTVALFSEDKDRLFALADAYAMIARNRRLSVTAVQYLLATKTDPSKFETPRIAEETQEAVREWQKDYLVEQRRGEPFKIILKRDLIDVPMRRQAFRPVTIGVGLNITGVEALLRFQAEAGLHRFRVESSNEGGNPDVLVETEAGKIDDYLPPERIERRGSIGSQPPRRMYFADQQRISDAEHNQSIDWEGDLVQPLTTLTGLNMRDELMRLVLE
jgi:hypothetical protein